MPRHIDHGQRKLEVAEAVWRVVRRSGLANASVRAVAQEAGISVGSLRHFFGEQRDLQIYAFQMINERARKRLDALPEDLPVRTRIEQNMWALLPVTQEQIEEEQVRLAFLVESRTAPVLAEIVAQDRAVLIGLMREAVIALQDIGEIPNNIDIDGAVTEMSALLDGLAQAAALNPEDMPGPRLKAAVRRWFDELPQRFSLTSH